MQSELILFGIIIYQTLKHDQKHKYVTVQK